MAFPFAPATPTVDVARALLGTTLWRELPDGTRLAGRVVETEAYLGLTDPAAHSFHGRRTARVASMYLPAGHAYVYRIYGLHHCLNVVTGDASRPEAVLIRALAPLTGLERMRRHRGFADRGGDPDDGADARHVGPGAPGDVALCSGPAKLVQALAIGPGLDGHPLDRPPLWLEVGPPVGAGEVAVGPRVGLSERVASQAWPLRFWVRGEPNVSARRAGLSADARTPASRSARTRRRRAG
jgi:DNA-3-methyladenine glycosylase